MSASENREDSLSMTPPLSPVYRSEELVMDFQDDSQLDKLMSEEILFYSPVCFNCCGETEPNDFSYVHAEGPLRRNTLYRLLNLSEQDCTAFQGISTDLFDQQIITQRALKDNTQKLFYLAMKNISQFKTLCQASTGFSGTGNAQSYMKFRHNIQTFFDYIKAFLSRYVDEDESRSFIPKLMSNLHHLLLHIGRLKDLPSLENMATKQGNSSRHGSYHIIHAYFDMQWNILQILHIISCKFPDDISVSCIQLCERLDTSEGDIFSQALQLLLWDLVVAAINRHNSLSLNVYQQTSPFMCTCIRELWTLVILLTDHRHDQLGKESFWVGLQHVLQEILQPEEIEEVQPDSRHFKMPPFYHSQNTVGFCFWLLTHLSPLYGYDMKGQYQHATVSSSPRFRSNYIPIQALIKMSTTASVGRLEENSRRCYLRCCVRMTSLWEPNIDILNILWDVFYKKLNDTFHSPTFGVEGLGKLSKSAIGWVEQCKERLESQTKRLETENSFSLFLRLMSLHLTGVLKNGGSQEWKQMKGRFYSRFHQRRMLELTETGLVNFTSLFLTLALVGETDDVASRMFDLYNLLNFDVLDHTRRCVLWRGVFSVMIILKESSDIPCNFTDKMVTSFSNVCREFSKQTDHSRRYQLWTLITIYFEGTQDVFENSEKLTAQDAKLLGAGFSQVLSACNQNEMRILLTFLQMVLTRHRLLYKMSGQTKTTGFNPEVKLVSDALWQNFFSFVKEHSTTRTPPSQLADVAASFTLLALDMPPSLTSGVKENLLSLFNYFCIDSKVNARIILSRLANEKKTHFNFGLDNFISCRYLSHTLANDVIKTRLSDEVPTYQTMLIQAWYRCCLLAPDSATDQIQELTRLVLKLPRMSEVFADTEPGEEYENVVQQFTKAIGSKYKNTEGWLQRIQYRDEAVKYFAVMPSVIGPVLHNGSPDAVKNVYCMTGRLFKYCAPLLYVKAKADSLLPPLYNLLLNPGKTHTQYMYNSLKSYLHMYIQGLAGLDYRRDLYLKDMMSSMIVFYLNKFQTPASSTALTTSVHPLLVALAPSCAKDCGEEAVNLHLFTIETLRDKLMSMKGMTIPSTANQAVTFLGNLFQRSSSSRVMARDTAVLTPIILQYLLVFDSGSLRNKLLYLLQCLLEGSKRHPDITDRAVLEKILTDFIKTYFKSYPVKVLLLLEKCAVLHPEAVQWVLPVTRQVIEESERKRGVGTDANLRQHLSSLNKACGSAAETS